MLQTSSEASKSYTDLIFVRLILETTVLLIRQYPANAGIGYVSEDGSRPARSDVQVLSVTWSPV